MKKILGIFGLLVTICVYTAIMEPNFLTENNIENLVRRTALYGIISIGVVFVIITGGIDLSIGSVVGLVGVILPWLLVKHQWSVPASLAMVMLVSLSIGLLHGLLITKMKLQPFVVTLCGLMFYRGLARYIAGDNTMGFGSDFMELKEALVGRLTPDGLTMEASSSFAIPMPFGNTFSFAIPMSFIIMVIIAVIASIFLNKTIYGRYLLALGRNEQAARFSGIRTDRMVILAYVICSMLAGFGGVLFALDVNSVQPSNHGNFYELYAIAAAVLGGCSLRGGEGTILGVVIGAAVMRVLYNAIILLEIPSQLEFCIIGAVILAGVIADELVKRVAAARRATREARQASLG